MSALRSSRLLCHAHSCLVQQSYRRLRVLHRCIWQYVLSCACAHFPSKQLNADTTTTSAAFAAPTTTGASLVPVISTSPMKLPCGVTIDSSHIGGDFPQGIGYVMATPNMTVVPITATGTTTYGSTSTPSPTVASGTVTDGCLQCEQSSASSNGHLSRFISRLYRANW